MFFLLKNQLMYYRSVMTNFLDLRNKIVLYGLLLNSSSSGEQTTPSSSQPTPIQTSLFDVGYPLNGTILFGSFFFLILKFTFCVMFRRSFVSCGNRSMSSIVDFRRTRIGSGNVAIVFQSASSNQTR